MLSRGLKACRPVQRPLLNEFRKQRRFLRAQQHRRCGLRHWHHVIYTDESRFLLHRFDERVRVRRQKGKRFRKDRVVGTVMADGGSVHTWDGIHHGGKTDLVVLQNSVNGDRYRHLLQTELIPYARQRFRRNVLLQHDNAPQHRARVVQDFLLQQQIDKLPWPAYSPDCNPIEHS